MIHNHLELTRTSQNLAEKAPVWQNVTMIVSGLPGKEVPVRADLNGLEIYADPLIGKGFYTLHDNSLPHGQNVTEIRVHYALVPDGSLSGPGG